MTKARLTYLAVIACLVLAFMLAVVLPLTSSDGSV